MVFSSMTFLCVFLPVVFLLYSVLPSIPVKNGLLIIASLLFYAYGEPKYVLLMIFSIVMNYLFGRLLDSENERLRRMIVGLAVCVNLALLFVFKYLDMVLKTVNQISHSSIPMANLALPIGISFFTFQALSYVIDVYRRDVEAEKNLFHVMLYISFFPQLIAGPIVKYHDIQEQIRSRKTDSGEIAAGMRRFILGLAKKVLISNVMAVTADALFAAPMGEMNILSAWTAAIAYLFQIYFDFSGYSDMAIGLGKMFNIELPINFNSPYKACSVKELWQRWHMTLSRFFIQYVYIPMGGSRKGKARTIFNTFMVFFLSGLWHGANWNYVLWGCYYGALLLIEKLVLKKVLNRLPGIIQRIYTMFFVVIGWIIFKCEDMAYGISYLKAMFGGFGQGLWNNETLYLLGNYAVLFVLAILGSTMLPKKAAGVVLGGRKRTWAENVIYIAFYAVIFFVSVAYLVDATYNPFLYFRF